MVVRWSRKRKRYERQGILVENDAIEHAAQQCLDDADARARRRHANRRAGPPSTRSSATNSPLAIREQFPGCPPARAEAIAYHAAVRGSGRIGRSAAGRALDADALRLAVAASVRHVDTDYDDLLMSRCRSRRPPDIGYATASTKSSTPGVTAPPSSMCDCFQWENAMGDTSIGVIGILAYWLRGHFWLCTIIVLTIQYIGDGAGHIYFWLAENNTKPYNIGFPLWTDFLVLPIVMWALYIWVLTHRRRCSTEGVTCTHCGSAYDS